MTVVSALTAAARRGILIRAATRWRRRAACARWRWTRPARLTTGNPALVQWQALAGFDGAQAAAIAWQLASRSEHPVSRAIATGLPAVAHNVTQLQALPGRGVKPTSTTSAGSSATCA